MPLVCVIWFCVIGGAPGGWFVPCPRSEDPGEGSFVSNWSGGRILLGVVAGLPLVGHALGPADDPKGISLMIKWLGFAGWLRLRRGTGGMGRPDKTPPRQPPDRHD